MTHQEARKLTPNQIVTDGSRYYTVQIPSHNQHDLWFWWTNKKTRKMVTANGGQVRRVYLGSLKLQPSGLNFLAKLSINETTNRKGREMTAQTKKPIMYGRQRIQGMYEMHKDVCVYWRDDDDHAVVICDQWHNRYIPYAYVVGGNVRDKLIAECRKDAPDIFDVLAGFVLGGGIRVDHTARSYSSGDNRLPKLARELFAALEAGAECRMA